MKTTRMKNWRAFTYCVFVGLFLSTSSLAEGEVKPKEAMKTINQNKQLILRFFDEVFNQQYLSAIDELYATDVVDHTAFPDQTPGIEGIRETVKWFLESFDDLSITVEEVIAEDNKVVTRETWRATHKRSGKAVEGSVIHIFRIRDGRITDEWSKGWSWLEKL